LIGFSFRIFNGFLSICFQRFSIYFCLLLCDLLFYLLIVREYSFVEKIFSSFLIFILRSHRMGFHLLPCYFV
jgi:hypothetical protein